MAKEIPEGFQRFFSRKLKIVKRISYAIAEETAGEIQKKKLTEIIEKTSYIIPKIIGKRTPWRIFKEFVKKFFNLRLPLRLWVLWYSRLIVFVSFLLLFFYFTCFLVLLSSSLPFFLNQKSFESISNPVFSFSHLLKF